MSIIAAHHYISICHLRKQENIAIYLPVLQRFDSAFFQTLPNLNVHPGVAVYHTLKIFSIVNAKDLLMPHTKFQVCTLKINTIFCHRKKKSHYFWTGVYNSLRCCFPGGTLDMGQLLLFADYNVFVCPPRICFFVLYSDISSLRYATCPWRNFSQIRIRSWNICHYIEPRLHVQWSQIIWMGYSKRRDQRSHGF